MGLLEAAVAQPLRVEGRESAQPVAVGGGLPEGETHVPGAGIPHDVRRLADPGDSGGDGVRGDRGGFRGGGGGHDRDHREAVIFMEHGVNLQNARIATLGERAEDVFFITDRDGHPISNPDLCEKLANALRSQLDTVN